MGKVVEHTMRGMPSDENKSPDADLRDELRNMEARVRKLRDTRNSLRDQGKAVAQTVSYTHLTLPTKA